MFQQILGILEKQSALKLSLMNARAQNFEKALESQESLGELSSCEAASIVSAEAVAAWKTEATVKEAVLQWSNLKEQVDVQTLLSGEMDRLRELLSGKVTEILKASGTACEVWQGGKFKEKWHDDIRGPTFTDIVHAGKQSVMKVDVATQLKAVTTQLTKDCLERKNSEDN